MKLQVLGPGCANCGALAQRAETAARELGLDYEIEKIEDYNAIASMGVMRTPALAVDGAVKLAGRVPSVAEVKEILCAGPAPGGER